MKKISSPNFNLRPKNTIINTIIINYTVINQAETIKKFCDPKAKVSSHYLISKSGEVISFVETDKRAWHAGISSWKEQYNLNDNSIGIELENNGKEKFTIEQYQALSQIITKLKKLLVILLMN